MVQKIYNIDVNNFSKILKPLIYTVAILVVLFILSVSFVLAYRYFYKDKIINNIKYSGIELSGKTKSEADQIISEQNEILLKNEITFKANDKIFKSTYFGTGFLIDNSASLNETYNLGRTNSIAGIIDFYKIVFKGKDVQPKPIIIDNTRNAFLDTIKNEFEKSSIDASFVIDGDKISIKPEEIGYRINIESLYDKIYQGFYSKQTEELNIPLDEEKPLLVISDLTPGLEKALALSNRNIKLSYESKIIPVTKTNLLSWLSFDKTKNYEPYFDIEKIKIYSSTIASQNNVSVIDKRIDYVSNAVIQNGRVGKALDILKTSQLIMDNITKSDVTIPLPVSTINFSTTGRFHEAYIDVDLFAHKVVMVDKNNVIIFNTRFMDGGYDDNAPSGTYRILSKAEHRFSSIWQMDMPYWQNFVGNYGFHAAGMGTAGCIGLVDHDAKKLFNLTSIGTVVYVHDSDPNPSCSREFVNAQQEYHKTGEDIRNIYLKSSQCVKNMFKNDYGWAGMDWPD